MHVGPLGTKVWFVMIKDGKGRFPGNALWADGWGWALFKSDAPDKQAATDFKRDCQGCHIPAEKTDWVYVQGYPVLSASKGFEEARRFSKSFLREILTMRKYLLAVIVAVGLIGVTLTQQSMEPVAAQTQQSTAVFDSAGRLKLPDPATFRRWVFVGAPLTPNGLSDGKAGFPEYHLVYIEPKNIDAYLKTGSFPEETMIVKELTRVLDPTFPDGSPTEPSGRGYFNGQYNGIDVTVKDSRRFAKTNGWGFFTFGHHALPYAETAAESPASECAGCHQAYVSKTDMTWVQFYPILHSK